MMLRILVLLSFCIALVSCVSKKKLTYLRRDLPSANLNLPEPYRVRPNDNLFIEIKSPDPSTSAFYNMNGDKESGLFNDAFIYLKSHAVDASGVITLPFVGVVPVKGLTVQESSKEIQRALAQHLRDVTVFTKLVSNEVTILGEVNSPGTYMVYDGETTIFNALGLAGDITQFGKRKAVKVLRSDNNGRQLTYEIDLTSYEVLGSKGYYIYPHDIIVVDPLRIRSSQINLRSLAVLLSGVAVALLVLRSF